MLFDPKWEAKPTVAGMIAWIEETKDPNETYYWLRKDGCPCSQYAASIGTKFEYDTGVWTKLNLIARPYPFMNTSETFGNLLERLRASL
jgi:hypothetical protein